MVSRFNPSTNNKHQMIFSCIAFYIMLILCIIYIFTWFRYGKGYMFIFIILYIVFTMIQHFAYFKAKEEYEQEILNGI